MITSTSFFFGAATASGKLPLAAASLSLQGAPSNLKSNWPVSTFAPSTNGISFTKASTRACLIGLLTAFRHAAGRGKQRCGKCHGSENERACEWLDSMLYWLCSGTGFAYLAMRKSLKA
jgi:hypothetical protein